MWECKNWSNALFENLDENKRVQNRKFISVQKPEKKKSQLDYSNRQIFHIGTLAYYFLQSLTYNKTDNDTVTVKVSRPDRINPAGQLALTVFNRP